MPELPDITVYVEALRARIVGQSLEGFRAVSLFVVRTFDPPMETLLGHRVESVERLGKRIVLGFEGDLYLVIHLMIAGRLLWKEKGTGPPGKITLATFTFPNGMLILTEASSKKRASLHLVAGSSGLASHDPGGLEPLDMTLEQFEGALTEENRTLKRALTQPSRFSGIGNAYSDEILHAARLSPMRLTKSLDQGEIARLFDAVRGTLATWTDRLRKEFGERFPGSGQITAFRPDFAAHGKFGKPCPVCGKPIQRIVYADNETNYCAVCQNEGRILADRALSRLLRDDWPRAFADD
ncbi:MAG: hypothetical protein K1X67_19085 [Fimbriimonadaceae bacterium]|nr:hypothetical protein [Fimbriimonadaceae bacterium]